MKKLKGKKDKTGKIVFSREKTTDELVQDLLKRVEMLEKKPAN